MTERKPHPDNDLIDRMQEEGGVAEGGRSGGNVNRDVGTRTEQHTTVRDTGMERPTGQDNPADDAIKGDKTTSRLDPAQKGPKSE